MSHWSFLWDELFYLYWTIPVLKRDWVIDIRHHDNNISHIKIFYVSFGLIALVATCFIAIHIIHDLQDYNEMKLNRSRDSEN